MHAPSARRMELFTDEENAAIARTKPGTKRQKPRRRGNRQPQQMHIILLQLQLVFM